MLLSYPIGLSEYTLRPGSFRIGNLAPRYSLIVGYRIALAVRRQGSREGGVQPREQTTESLAVPG